MIASAVFKKRTFNQIQRYLVTCIFLFLRLTSAAANLRKNFMLIQKGFSLLEVLISLSLVTTLALSLITQQTSTQQFLIRLIMSAQGSQFLDKVEESLIFNERVLPNPSNPYHFIIKNNRKDISLNLAWFKKAGSIVRSHPSISTLS